ncbi:hypothetical protein F0M18_10420 [Pseudohalioglobus sediminis]|uniref:Uncharacterized protein n=1 Tax=Pseudohalioglobus sediminis TaxID=2606449 RepID=A0A5B0WXW6_9GAMM|nr:hypothetical protein [Pseudohalioglobus sediminis]KAA1191932.1 hypothetical protein F0M18_10420 [Pseudohalioglobus sediminis]
MNRKKLLKKLQSLLDKPDGARKKDIKKLDKVVKELKQKQKRLEQRLEDTQDEKERSRLIKEIEVIKLQRRKGIDAHRHLKGEHIDESIAGPD